MSSIIYYSSINNAFYPEHLKQEYIKSNSFQQMQNPLNILFSKNLHLNQHSEGKYRCVGEDGMPSWADIPPPTHEEQIAAAELKKQQLINQVNEYMNSKQWPGKAAIGRLKGEELAQYNLWLDYPDALELVETSSAPDIEWPRHRNVSDRASCRCCAGHNCFRPISSARRRYSARNSPVGLINASEQLVDFPYGRDQPASTTPANGYAWEIIYAPRLIQ